MNSKETKEICDERNSENNKAEKVAARETGAADAARAAVGVRAKRRVAGEVQGVGFRAAAREVALRVGARGWAKNESDGSVTVLMEGDAEGLAALDEFLRQGPPSARVAAVAPLMLETEDETAQLNDFGIL